MLRLHNIKLPLSYSGQSLAQAAAKALLLMHGSVKKAVDAYRI